MKIAHISKSFGDLPVLSGVSFEFPIGCTALVGPSGCGKTTLLRILAGLETPDEGQIEGAGRVSFVFQEDRLIRHYTLLDNLHLVCRNDAAIRQGLAAADLSEFAHTRVHLLSGGMKRRAACLRGALFDADTLLLDEPFNGVDIPRRDRLSQWIRERWQSRRMIVVSHEADDMARLNAISQLRL